MQKISDLITVVDNFVDKSFCKKTYNFLLGKTNCPYYNDNNMPWFIGNNVFYYNIDNKALNKKVIEINYSVAELLTTIHKVQVYPHFCDLVLWREGQSMERHVDDGSNSNNREDLNMRKYSAILYLNDDYIGGKTFIKVTNETDYFSVPKTGTLVMFTGDSRSAHGVTKIEKGNRGTIAMWFCTDKQFCQM